MFLPTVLCTCALLLLVDLIVSSVQITWNGVWTWVLSVAVVFYHWATLVLETLLQADRCHELKNRLTCVIRHFRTVSDNQALQNVNYVTSRSLIAPTYYKSLRHSSSTSSAIASTKGHEMPEKCVAGTLLLQRSMNNGIVDTSLLHKS